MTFFSTVGAYCVGWLLCNVFLFQLTDRMRFATKKRDEMLVALHHMLAEAEKLKEKEPT